MALSYEISIEDGMFKYDCINLSSCIKIRAEDIKKIYDILNRLDDIEKRAQKDGKTRYICNGFEMIFDFNGYVAINTVSNWLSISQEVPIIKRELRKYVKKYNIESVKDIIVKIKSLKKGE